MDIHGTRRRHRIFAAALVAALLASGGVAAAAKTSAKNTEKPACQPGHPGNAANADKAKCNVTTSTVDLPGPFTELDAFATKSGFRGVVSWSTDEPIVPVVRYGTDPTNLDQLAPVVDTPDTAGLAVIGDGTAVRLAEGTTYYVSVEDQLTGTKTPAIELKAANAYTDYGPNTEQDPTEVSFKPNVYTIDLLVQLDAQALPADVPADQALADLADGVNVFAERLYDAMDGHARVGNVLITDTNVAGLGSTPGYQQFHFPGTCDAPGNLADVLVTTAMPFDSHTFHYAIDEPCTPFYLGRVGQLVTPWEDDLHLGAVATHEMMHYAFGAPDLYGTGDITGTAAGGCRNLAWDGSVMHNSGGWETDHWELTEVDSDPLLTPCDHGGEPYTWDEAQSRYKLIPDRTVIEDIFNTKARGNPDGGALDISILDREPGSSTLTHVIPDDTNTTGADCSTQASTLSTSFADAKGDATSVLGLAQAPAETNEPALDILGEQVELSADGQTLTLEVEVDDLAAEPASASLGEWFDINFSTHGQAYDVVAEWDRSATTGATFTLNEFNSGRDAIAPVTGTWDVDTDRITVTVPAELTLEDGSPYTVFGDGDTINAFETTSRRTTGVVVPDADTASGGCPVRVPGEAPPPPTGGGVDATLSAANPSYTFEGEATTAVEPLVADGAALTGSSRTERLVKVDAPEGGSLSATLTASPTSYASIEIYGPSGQLDYSEAPAGETATVSGPATTGVYRITVTYIAAVESTFTATVTFAPSTGPITGTPAGTATLAKGGEASFEGAAPADTTAYECTGPFDASCVTYQIDATEAGELLAFIEAGLPVDDFDLVIYAADGTKVGSGGLPGTLPGGLESVSAPVTAGRYYVVVQPYTATKDLSTFSLTVSLG